MAQLADDCFAFGGPLLRVDEALAEFARRLAPVTSRETVALADAAGRILAEPVVAGRAVPPHDNSAVDGYAVFFDDLDPAAPTRLPVTGRIAAGHPLDRPVRRGEALRIFTGAPVPGGPDTVVMQEDCRAEGETVVIPPGLGRGANFRHAGEDVAAGTEILAAGRRLLPQDVGLAASVGLAALPVRRPLRVTLFSTGDEIREPGEPAPAGCVYDANRHVLAAMLRRLGCLVEDRGIVPDDPAALSRLLAEARSADLVVTSGGVSSGEEDHVKSAVTAAGGRLHAWRLAIKPGRPVALGQIGRTPFVGLPGNPVAVMVTFIQVARPIVLILAGADPAAPRLFPVRAGFDYRKKADRREYVRVRLAEAADGSLVAKKVSAEGAGILSSMVEAEGLVEVPEPVTRLRSGEAVRFLPFAAVL